MADQNNTTMDNLRDEITSMRSQLEEALKTAGEKRSQITDDVADRLAREYEHYKAVAGRKAEEFTNAGKMGLDEVGEHVRKNPLASLAIAFGAGCILSCLIRHLR